MTEEAKQEEALKAKEPAKAKETSAEGGEVAVKSAGGEVAEEGKHSPSAFFDFDREFERALEKFFHRGWLRSPRWEFPKFSALSEDRTPNVNVIDRDGEVLVEAELPGVEKDDLDVSLSENTVTIKASTRKEEEKEEGEYRRREISTGYYSRTLPLPARVEGEKAKAEFKNGVLRLTLPKSEQSRKVNIQVD